MLEKPERKCLEAERARVNSRSQQMNSRDSTARVNLISVRYLIIASIIWAIWAIFNCIVRWLIMLLTA